jgi:N-acetylglutamate synthase-like GNAT family acetyltransferase
VLRAKGLQYVIESPPSAIRRGQSSDLASIAELLRAAGLPTADLASAPGLRAWVLEIDGELSGTVALEGTEARSRLLRSLVIVPAHQRRGFGHELVARVERDARAEGVERLVLLTQTAQALFDRLGYEVIERASAPEPLRQSAEFRSLCPTSAVCMAKRLSRTRG